ncbi:diacylglycerol O-acyltransferase 2-like isoform X4 [Numida meleagris]|uniref:diacylglycerol O-acyltransferase 2-like isoform X4 n=1 Tax=Numida meleagris TaxID=8996 RepID=UPI000B3E1B6B|nr:diacylglycerol O-acyltransferase 2-like isoform X4 [Numida meleagris]
MPPCARCWPCPGPRSGMSVPGCSSSPCSSGCSASCCWVSGAVGAVGPGVRSLTHPIPQAPSPWCCSSTWCSPASGPSLLSTWPGSSLTGTHRRKLVKTHDLSPGHNYIIGSHPHGILCVGAFCNFITGSTGFSELFPGIQPFLTTLAGNFRLPLFREYLMSGGLCPVTRRAISYLLSKNGTGNAVAIVIGGAAESLSCSPGVTTLILKNRKGFVRMALQHGAFLVPSFSFGENELFRQVVFEEGSWMRAVQQRFQKMMGFAPCVFYGRGLTSVHSRGFLPYARPITTVVGEPVMVPKIEEPSSEVVDLYHGMYVRSLLKLFNDNKTKYGLSEGDKLCIV